MYIAHVYSDLLGYKLLRAFIIFSSHENASGFYRVSVYFIAKLVCDIIPLRFIPLVFFATIAYFMLGKFIMMHTCSVTRIG